jgi:uncharacterized protein YciI
MTAPESVKSGEEPKMVGSVALIEAESLEEAKKVIDNDAYSVANVVSKFHLQAGVCETDFR